MSLPSGYTRLEYIESTGTQYIDTGFIPNQDTRIDMVACPTSVVDAGGGAGFVPYGSAQSYNSRAFECYTVSAQYEFNYGTTYKSIGNAVIGQKVAITHNKNNVSLSINDGPLLTMSFIYSSFTTPYTMTLFGTHRSSILCGQQKIYSCQIRDNGHLIRNFIPCKNTNGVVGLWDDVNSQFYQNVGTGSFIAGEMPKGTHKTLVNGTVYEVKGGKCLVNGTSYDIKKGRTLIGGTGYDITFAPPPPMPVKGDLINMNLDGTSRLYRVLSVNGNVCKVLGMWDDFTSKYNGTSTTTNFNGITAQKYEGSDLDTYLNTTWYNTLSSEAKNAIVYEDVVQYCYQYYDEPNTSNTPTYTYQYQYNWSNSDYENADNIGNVTVGERNVFALDLKDIFDYFEKVCITSDELMTMFWNSTTKVFKYIWLRSSTTVSSGLAWSVDGGGGALNNTAATSSYVVRPALNLDMSKIQYTIV